MFKASYYEPKLPYNFIYQFILCGHFKKWHSFDQIFSFGNAYDFNTANPSTSLSIKAYVESRVRKEKYGINIT